MATTKVSALSALTTTDGAEELLINDGGTSKKVTIANLLHDNSIDSDHYVDGSIDTAHLADGAITAAKIADGTVVAAEIADNAVTTAKINADAVTGAKIADDAIDSEHIAADSIDAEHYAAGSVDTTALGADAVTGAKIADDAIDSEHYAAASIDTAHIGDDQVTYAKIQNVSATDRILGRDSSGAGVVEEITPANLRTMINVADGSNAYVHPNHSGEVTSTADGATVIADNIVDEANLKVSNSPTNGQFLSAQSGNTGGLTWADVDALPSQSGNSGEFLTTNGTAASWAEIATGNTTTSPMWEMAHTVSTNYTMTTNYNGVSVAPVTINSGVSVTVPTGSTWTIV